MRSTGKGRATTFSPGFMEVMERDCFITLWGFLHLVRGTRPWTSPTRFAKSGPCLTECSLCLAATTAPAYNSGSMRVLFPPRTASPSSSTYVTNRSDGASRASCCPRPRRATFSTQKSTRAGSRTATGPLGQRSAKQRANAHTRQTPPYPIHEPPAAVRLAPCETAAMRPLGASSPDITGHPWSADQYMSAQ